MKLTLTQFITYKLKVTTSAKIRYLRDIKNNGGYAPYADYWRSLRKAILEVAQGTKKLNSLYAVAENVDTKKKDNYYKDVTRFVNFVTKNQVKYLPVSSGKWEYRDLVVTASPEIGMEIKGKKYSVKIYYKVKKTTEKWLNRNVASTLRLMRAANPSEKKIFAILNLQNGKLYTEEGSNLDFLELEVDADTVLNIWKKI